MILEKILSSLFVNENLARSGRNFVALENEVNAKLGDGHNTDVSAHSDIRAQINNLAFSTYKNLGYVETGTLASFIKAKVESGQSKGTFYCTQLSDMPVIPWLTNVRYASLIGQTGAIFVELQASVGYYTNMLNYADGTFGEWIKFATTKQPDWITATLQNGWTGSLYYRKNQIGQLEIKGLLTTGTVAWETVITNLPEGYRLKDNYKPFSVLKSTGTVLLGLSLISNGDIRLYYPATGWEAGINILFNEVIVLD